MPAQTDHAAPSRISLVNTRVSPSERLQLLELAAAQGINLSELIRRGLQTQGFQPQR
jgi:hypothetical protein